MRPATSTPRAASATCSSTTCSFQTGVPSEPDNAEGLCDRGVLRSGGATLRLLASPGFREVVAFTPPHRQAFCVEPYTCATDADQPLQARRRDARA